MHTKIILIDLQKVFGTLGHKIFLDKMACIDFKTLVIRWLELYLSNGKFFVSVEETKRITETNLVWNVLDKARAYKPEAKRCIVCLTEKYYIIFSKLNLLNSRKNSS